MLRTAPLRAENPSQYREEEESGGPQFLYNCDRVEETSWPCVRCTFHNKRCTERCELCGKGRKGWQRGSEEGDGGSKEEEGLVGGDLAVSQVSDVGVTLFAIIPCSLKPVLNGALRGVIALLGSFAGAVAGAVAAQPSRGGILRGIGLGALAGAIVSVEALETSQLLFDGGSEPASRRRSESRNTSGSSSSSSGTTTTEAPGGGAPTFFSRLGRFHVSLFHWDTFSVNSGLEYALRELRLPPEVLIRITNTNGRYAYPTRDVGGGSAGGSAFGSRPSGLSPNELKEIPYEKASTTHGQCTICFESFKAGEHVRILPHCNHTFHARCLDPWLRKKRSCPLCRSDLGCGGGQD
ncbi:NEP1-interacting protein-like [Chloropicon primus]|uniref:RING-type domain-containing protein n=1 Tax=Chloropicon primus TaxID=1764295 RepID=A0A5B8MI89_9CHLO|nr:hypothetical protein A3770_04p28660 [Chloropicon primus]UPQ99556.1 NEP1-interacting protein-like [Chloropicon primus]|eukprot:QDZ20348.1 hypothetical protein A3770_04p28660 [Chloropicon primus]